MVGGNKGLILKQEEKPVTKEPDHVITFVCLFLFVRLFLFFFRFLRKKKNLVL